MKRFLCVMLFAACGGGGGERPSTAPVASASSTAKVLVDVDAEGVILGGFDPISYRDGEPAAGASEHATQYGGATYRFATPEHLAAFNGSEHAPAYGGYCAYAASQGRLSVADPTVFELYEGQLLVFTNAEFRDLFDHDRAGAKAKADSSWPRLVEQHGR